MPGFHKGGQKTASDPLGKSPCGCWESNLSPLGKAASVLSCWAISLVPSPTPKLLTLITGFQNLHSEFYIQNFRRKEYAILEKHTEGLFAYLTRVKKPHPKNSCQYFPLTFSFTVTQAFSKLYLSNITGTEMGKYHQLHIFCCHKLGNKILTCGQLALSPNSRFLKSIFVVRKTTKWELSFYSRYMIQRTKLHAI